MPCWRSSSTSARPCTADASKISVIVRSYGHAHTELWPLTEWSHFKTIIHELGQVRARGQELALRFIRTTQCNAPVLVFPAKAGIYVCHGTGFRRRDNFFAANMSDQPRTRGPDGIRVGTDARGSGSRRVSSRNASIG